MYVDRINKKIIISSFQTFQSITSVVLIGIEFPLPDLFSPCRCPIIIKPTYGACSCAEDLYLSQNPKDMFD